MNSVAIRIASSFDLVFRIAQPPMTSLALGERTVGHGDLPVGQRTRTPSLLGSTPGVDEVAVLERPLHELAHRLHQGGRWRGRAV
jgi:hypothetical protein